MWLVTDLDTLDTFLFNTVEAALACCEGMNISIEVYYNVLTLH